MAELQAVGFKYATYEEIRWTPTLTTRQVIGLTATFSSVARLPERKELWQQMRCS